MPIWLQITILYNLVVPVGSVLCFANNTNPNDIYTGTTWQKIEGKFLLGSSSSYALGSTGGRADTVLPEHNHGIWVPGKSFSAARSDTTQAGNNSLTKLTSSTSQTCESGDREKHEAPYIVANYNGDLMATKMGVTDYSETNLPPYEVVNYWKRVA